MTIFFAWVNAYEVDFNPAIHARWDEDVYSFHIEHEEGQMPVADIVIKNPDVGLLNTSRKQWAWLSTDVTGAIEPLFFGRILGIPSDLLGYQVTVRFIAKSNDYVARKQALADTLRVSPYYDPIFLSDEAMIDPDAVLEGYSAAYHVDRIPNHGRKALDWTISDIIEGEDGVLTFTEDEILFGSLSMNLNQSPLRAVRVDAKVHWSQNFRGQTVPIFGGWVKTLTGEHLAQEWPKPGQDLGGGWVADIGSMAVAIGGGNGTYSESGSWQDQNQYHNEGDTISASWSVTLPLSPGVEVNRQESATYGNIGGGHNFIGTPGFGGAGSVTNSSGSSGYSATWNVLSIWRVYCQLFIRPNNSPNDFTETFTFTLYSDIQHILGDPDAKEETEVITLESQDVGEAAYDFKAWTSLAGKPVQLGQIMLPNTRTVGPGGDSFQICIVPGTMGTIEVLYSDIIGDITVDGNSQWACVGPKLPLIDDWAPSTYYRVGQIICAEDNGGWFYVCVQEGFTGSIYPFPNGTMFPPAFGQSYADYQVVWTSLRNGGPSLAVPIGGQPGNIIQNGFFAQNRGALAISAAIMKARARMLTRARAVEISATVGLREGLGLSCRMNATFETHFIPGNIATGKVIKYVLRGDGETGEFLADITIGCAVGVAGTPYVSADGFPLYVQSGYVQSGYQATSGRVVSHGDVSFTPPPPSSTTNGFTSPLTAGQVVVQAQWHGSLANQIRLAKIAYSPASNDGIGVTKAQDRGKAFQKRLELAQQQLNSEAGSVFFQLQLKPIGGLSTSTPYVIDVSRLIIPKQIDLGA
jgi:hypothetical protein